MPHGNGGEVATGNVDGDEAPLPRVVGRGPGVQRVSLSLEADGDVHMNLRLDEPYRGLLNAGNDHEDGNLVVEPVCQIPPMQAEAIRVCASDPNPDLRPLPAVGAHVWMEGRHVLDLQHYSWAELHPLYRWGSLRP